MLDKIFNLIFDKNSKSIATTVIKNREYHFNCLVEKKYVKGQNLKLTYSDHKENSLSEYFSHRKGLNMKERLFVWNYFI